MPALQVDRAACGRAVQSVSEVAQYFAQRVALLVRSATHAPPQQLGSAGGQSLNVQQSSFGMHSSRQTFCPLGQLDAHRPSAQT